MSRHFSRHASLLAATFLAALAGAATVATAADVSVPLIPREALFGNPERSTGRISPDGTQIAFIAPRDGVMNLWVAPIGNIGAAKPLTAEKLRPIRQYFWAPDSKQLLFVNDVGGDENFLLYSVNTATGASRTLTPFQKTRVEIVGVSTNIRDRILISANNRDPEWHDLYSLDLASGALTPVMINKGNYASYLADDGLNLRAVSVSRDDGSYDYFRVVDGKVEDKPFEQVSMDDALTTAPLGYTADGKTLYWLDSRNRDTAALIAQDVATGARTVLAEDARADIGAAISEPETGRILAYGVDYLRNEWKPLDAATGADLKYLQDELKGDIIVTSQTRDNQRWLVAVDAVTSPINIYLYDRPAKKLTRLYTTRPALTGTPLVAMYPESIPSRDGKTLVSYLTLPPGSDANGDGVPEKPVPLIMFPHGGPWARDSYGYDGWHQWMANRGYAVLSPNFRASTGFGKAFLAAGNLQWGRTMQDDLDDSIDWAVKRGITTRDKVAILGGSYGGYAVLAGMTMTPDRYACGVDIVGPSNLETLLKTIPPYWKSFRAQFYQRMGDPNTPEGLALLKERSPLYLADKIKAPLLIAQGANDPRVNVAESEQIVKAMKANNIPVTYVVFPDEGHGFARPQNNIAFIGIAEQFLAKCLGGRAEPLGEVVRQSTAKVEDGVSLVPGLTEATTVK